jgi:hypothetical protein
MKGGGQKQHVPIAQFLGGGAKNITTLVFGREHLIIREFSLFKEVLGPKPHKRRVISVNISLRYTYNINNTLASLQIDIENITSSARIEAVLMSILSHKGEVKLTPSGPAAGYYHRNLLQALFLLPESHKLYNISE